MDATFSPAFDDTAPVTEADADAELNVAWLAAAGGDHDAQAALAINALQYALDGIVPATDAFACAEMFARMAVTSGKAEHIMTLARILGNRYDVIGNSGLDEGSLAPLHEFYLLMHIAGDAGDPAAAGALKTLSDIVAVAPAVAEAWEEIRSNPLAQVGATPPTQPDTAPAPVLAADAA